MVRDPPSVEILGRPFDIERVHVELGRQIDSSCMSYKVGIYRRTDGRTEEGVQMK